MELLNKEIKFRQEEKLSRLENCREGVRKVRDIINSQNKHNGILGWNNYDHVKEFNCNCNDYDKLMKDFNKPGDPKISLTNETCYGNYNTLETNVNIETRLITYKLSYDKGHLLERYR